MSQLSRVLMLAVWGMILWGQAPSATILSTTGFILPVSSSSLRTTRSFFFATAMMLLIRVPLVIDITAPSSIACKIWTPPPPVMT